MKRALVLLAICAAIACVVKCRDSETATNANQPYGTLGNLLEVGFIDTAPFPEQRVSYEGMEISFNPEAHLPNWVAWELTADEVDGEEPRARNFESDPNVKGCAKPADYRNSGYDRGHMAPAADMKWSREAMRQSFLLTNICPQAHALNAGAWKKLEEKCRQRALADSVVYIVCGPVLTDEIRDWIGESEVAVPKRFFKVIISPYSNPPRGIGFVMNNGYVKGGMQQAACSIDDVETLTGLDFFASLPDSLEAVIEAQNDFHGWSRIPRR